MFLIAALLSGALWADGSVTVRSVSPDGESDMTAAILSAIESLRATGGGVVWYQGESNSGKGEYKVYAGLVAELITQWRKDLLDERLPFAVVQIADLDVRRDDAWRGIQNAQLRIPPLCPNVTTIKCADICETNTIHPPTKEPLARRLVDWALSATE